MLQMLCTYIIFKTCFLVFGVRTLKLMCYYNPSSFRTLLSLYVFNVRKSEYRKADFNYINCVAHMVIFLESREDNGFPPPLSLSKNCKRVATYFTAFYIFLCVSMFIYALWLIFWWCWTCWLWCFFRTFPIFSFFPRWWGTWWTRWQGTVPLLLDRCIFDVYILLLGPWHIIRKFTIEKSFI